MTSASEKHAGVIPRILFPARLALPVATVR